MSDILTGIDRRGFLKQAGSGTRLSVTLSVFACFLFRRKRHQREITLTDGLGVISLD
jgi:hypothetical protein